MKTNLKTKVSALLAVLMMLTCIPWTTPVTASAAQTETVYSYDMCNQNVGAYNYTTTVATTTSTPLFTTASRTNSSGTLPTRPSDFTPSWTEAVSLLPPAASEFTLQEAGEGQITVTPQGSGYRFEATQGWPYASYDMGENGIAADTESMYLNYDIEVLDGQTSMYVFFGGKDPQGVVSNRWFVSINYIIDPRNVDANTGNVENSLTRGRYVGSAPISRLNYDEQLLDEQGRMVFSGLKIIAEGDDDSADIIVHELSVGGQRYDLPSFPVGIRPVLSTTTMFTPSRGRTTVTTTTSRTIQTSFSTMPTRPSDYTPNWTETVSLMPAAASEFTLHNTDGGQITVTPQGSGYRFDATMEWPQAMYVRGKDGIVCNENDDLYLNYDFEVTAGGAEIDLIYGDLTDYFIGYKPGYCENLSTIVTPHNYLKEIPVGKYSGSVKISKLNYYEYLKDSDGDMLFAGCGIIAVGHDASVTVNELSIGNKKYTEVTDLSPEWTQTVSLMPATASEFVESEGEGAGNGIIEVMHEGEGYRFMSNGGWPAAHYVDEENWIYVNENDDLYLNYDIDVISGETNVIVYFGGQNPNESAAEGTFVSINGFIDPLYVDENGSAVVDLPVGKYSGSVKISNLTIAANLVDEDGDVMFSGCRIFAVDENGSVVVRELSIGKKKGEEEEKPIGDMSGDGELNTMDALLLFAVINGAKTATTEQQALADFNGDGTLNMMDALLLFKRVSGQ
ncbi:MAG: dockerin type I repeat-containing protein [Clostridia bacterium]|nr:dockerin type I repeat-containing protein [Clostridia bacterium]